jgi:transcriptional antiterminator NusG
MTLALRSPFPEYLDQPAMPDDSSNVVPFTPRKVPLWSSTGPAWMILRVTSNMARKVSEVLTEAGIRCYVPIEKYRPANHWKAKTRPLIPGYLFAEILNDDHLDLARENHAVREVMCDHERPVQLPSVVIGTMVAMEALHMFDRTWKPVYRTAKGRGKRAVVHQSRWEHGQRVRVIHGPFATFEGTITRIDRNSRLEVLLTIFGRATPISADDSSIEPMS